MCSELVWFHCCSADVRSQTRRERLLLLSGSEHRLSSGGVKVFTDRVEHRGSS